jgi:hypothetical protein
MVCAGRSSEGAKDRVVTAVALPRAPGGRIGKGERDGFTHHLALKQSKLLVNALVHLLLRLEPVILVASVVAATHLEALVGSSGDEILPRRLNV